MNASMDSDRETRADEWVGTGGRGKKGVGWEARLNESWRERKRGRLWRVDC